MTRLRIYADTSVIGGCFDAAFAEHSRRLFDGVRTGRLILLLSEVVIRELGPAPAPVRAVLETLPTEAAETVPLTPELHGLVGDYLRAGIVAARSVDDALHVAAATVARADAIVSWNFKHIVRLDKIKAYNEVNARRGYPPLTILSPREVDFGDDD